MLAIFSKFIAENNISAKFVCFSGQKGFGITFTLGRGNEIVAHCIDSLRWEIQFLESYICFKN